VFHELISPISNLIAGCGNKIHIFLVSNFDNAGRNLIAHLQKVNSTQQNAFAFD